MSFRFQFFFVNCQNLNEILHISGNIQNTKKADHILEMPRKSYFVIINSTILQLNETNLLYDQRRPLFRLASVMLLGTPCNLLSVCLVIP